MNTSSTGLCQQVNLVSSCYICQLNGLLVSRTSESDASARESRWRVLGRLVEGREAKEMLGPEMDTSMRTALREGPHYTPVETQVGLAFRMFS